MPNDNAINTDELLSSGNDVDDKKEGEKAYKKKLAPSIKIHLHKPVDKGEIDASFFLREPKIAFSEYVFVVPKTPIFDLFLEFFACFNKKDKGDSVIVERNFTCSTPSIRGFYQQKGRSKHKCDLDFTKDNDFQFKLGMDLDSYSQFNRDCFFAFINIFNKLYLRFIDKKDENRVLKLEESIISFNAEELGVTDKELDLLCNLKFTFNCSNLNAAFKNELPSLVDYPCFAKVDGCFIITGWFLFIMFWTANLGYRVINRGFLSCNKLDIGCILCALELCFNANFRNKAYSKSVFFSDECLSKFQTKLPNTIQYLSYLKESSPKNYSPVMLRRKFLSYFKTLQKRGYFHIFIQNSKDENNCIPVTDIDPGELQGNRMTARIDFNLKDTKFKYNVIWYSLDKKTKLKQKSTLF